MGIGSHWFSNLTRPPQKRGGLRVHKGNCLRWLCHAAKPSQRHAVHRSVKNAAPPLASPVFSPARFTACLLPASPRFVTAWSRSRRRRGAPGTSGPPRSWGRAWWRRSSACGCGARTARGCPCTCGLNNIILIGRKDYTNKKPKEYNLTTKTYNIVLDHQPQGIRENIKNNVDLNSAAILITVKCFHSLILTIYNPTLRAITKKNIQALHKNH